MNISIITITFNNYEDLIRTLESTEGLICERIVINGGGCERTLELLQSRPDIISISEPDKGIADAFNKGLRLSTQRGIWFLNSGDICINEDYVKFATAEIENYDFIYANVLYNSPLYGNLTIKPRHNKPIGMGMPYPHPGMIINRRVFKQIGLFDLKYKISMDFELVCRMIIANMRGRYFPHAVALMSGEGISSTNIKQSIQEDLLAIKKNNLGTPLNWFWIQLRLLKYFTRKLMQNLGLLKPYQVLKKILKSFKRSKVSL